MRILFIIILMISSFSAFASRSILTTIHDVDYGKTSDDEVLVFLGSGDVAKVKETNDIFKRAKLINMKGKWFNITLDDNRYITDLTEGEGPTSTQLPDDESFAQYVPTTIENMEVAKNYFREARYNPKDSQCFNRAIVWVYEWWKKHSLKTNKVWIYFSRTYIRRYNFEWWFHVAPLAHIMDNGKVVERVMDIKYSSRPLPLQTWSNLFMRNDATCNVITKFSDYADFPYTGECYIQRSNMYYYQPADLQMNEAWGFTKNNFLMNEVRGAYLEAYDEVI